MESQRKLEYYYLFEGNSVRTAHLLCNVFNPLSPPTRQISLVYKQILGKRDNWTVPASEALEITWSLHFHSRIGALNTKGRLLITLKKCPPTSIDMMWFQRLMLCWYGKLPKETLQNVCFQPNSPKHTEHTLLVLPHWKETTGILLSENQAPLPTSLWKEKKKH